MRICPECLAQAMQCVQDIKLALEILVPGDENHALRMFVVAELGIQLHEENSEVVEHMHKLLKKDISARHLSGFIVMEQFALVAKSRQGQNAPGSKAVN